MCEGAVWVAYGKQAEYQAGESVKSYLEHNNTPTRVFSEDWGDENKSASRYAKTSLMQWHTFDYFLYLDADTRIRGSVKPIFDILRDGWDMVIVPSANQGDECFWHISLEEVDYTLDGLGYLPLQLQCGVLGVARNERTVKFWDAWHFEWMRYHEEDQAAFLRALDQVPLKVWIMGRPWNGGAAIEHRFGAMRQ